MVHGVELCNIHKTSAWLYHSRKTQIVLPYLVIWFYTLSPLKHVYFAWLFGSFYIQINNTKSMQILEDKLWIKMPFLKQPSKNAKNEKEIKHHHYTCIVEVANAMMVACKIFVFILSLCTKKKHHNLRLSNKLPLVSHQPGLLYYLNLLLEDELLYHFPLKTPHHPQQLASAIHVCFLSQECDTAVQWLEPNGK